MPGDTPARLAARGPVGDAFRADTFLLLNGLRPGETLPPGRRVKIVVAE